MIRKILLICSIFFAINTYAADRTVNLVVGYKTVNFAGKSVQAIAVNNQIPAPTLHFKEGDHVTINVYNHLDQGTTIHWHGLLIPWQMDGVEGVSQEPIPPGGVFHYQFTLKQSGTYWYHAHAGLQEQQGLYGGFIIDPAKPPNYKYNKNYVVVLSDWINTNPDQVYANLKKEGDYYSPKFPLQPSLVRFIRDYQKASPQERKLLIDDYKMMQDMRMSIYDISDVAYDAFLLNGHTLANPWTAPVKVGDIVRLRFIGAGAGTMFHIKIPGTTMQVVHMQGHDVKPYEVNDITILPGETTDVLVKIKKDTPYIIYAESADKVGKIYGALITHPQQQVDYQQVKPFPTPESTTREMMANMSMPGMDHGSMDMGGMNMSSMKMDHAMNMDSDVKTVGTKYQNVVAAYKTNDPNIPVEIIHMALYGYMGKYIWFINGVPEYKAKPIMIEPGKRYRIIFNNQSMMHHPMHIHGHFFILRNGHGAYDPFLHTIDVPPGATVVADFDANTDGQWFFHCHFLYHMMAGMSRVFQYTTLKHDIQTQQPTPAVVANDPMNIDITHIEHPMGHPPGLFRSSYLEFGNDFFNNNQQATFRTLIGSDYNKLQFYTEDAEVDKGQVQNADIDIFYWHLISEFWAVKGGVNYFYRPAITPYWQPGVGIEGLMPYFIDTNVRLYYHSGSAKLDIQLSRDTQITNKFFLRLGIRSILATNTVTQDVVGSGLNQMRYFVRPYYQFNPNVALYIEYENQQNYGAFKTIQANLGNPASENTVSLGLAFLF